MLDQDKSKEQLIEELAKANEELQREIEERRRSEESLRLSETQTRLLLDSLPVGVVAILDGTIVYINPATVHLYGARRPDDLLGMDVLKILPEDRRPILSSDLEKLLSRSEAAQPHDGAILRSDGTRLEVEASAAPLSLDGRPGALIAFRDITERKQAEEELRASEERFRVTFEEAPVGMVIGVGDGVIAKANRAVCRMTGYTQEELVGRHVRDLTHPEDRELSGPFVKRLMAGEIPGFTLEKRYLRKDSQPFWAQATTAAIQGPDGKFAFALGIVEDITERKRAEEALRQSRDELAKIYDGMFDGLLMVDLETKQFARANPSICQMLGYSEKELLSMSLLDIHPPEDIPVVLQRVQARAEGRFRGQATVRLMRKDGSLLWAEVAGNLLTYGGRPCITGFFRDITERKYAEEALRKEYRNLRHMLRSSDNERQLIAYEIHDGLAQQLAGAIMQFDAFDHLKETKPKQAADAYHAAITMLRQGHFETRRLIAGVRPPILDESGIVEAVAHLVHEVGRDTGPKIENRSRVDFDRLDPTLENAIYRIAQEALTNACKHSKSERISVSLLQRADRLRIEIRDWGVGFDPKAVPKSHFGLDRNQANLPRCA